MSEINKFVHLDSTNEKKYIFAPCLYLEKAKNNCNNINIRFKCKTKDL